MVTYHSCLIQLGTLLEFFTTYYIILNMEKQIKSFSELQVGDLVLIESPMSLLTLGEHEDYLCVVTSIIPTHKYPITEQSGRKCYMKDRKSHYADEVGDTGNEMIKEWGISSSVAGEYTFREDDTPIWNIRLIDKSHPQYDSKLANHGKMMNGAINLIAKMLK